MSLDRIGFAVTDFARSRASDTAALAPLGIVMVEEGEGWAMLGLDGEPRLSFGATGTPPGRIHLAFAAAGAEDNRAPGPRPQYHPDYYGAFVIAPNGHNTEAVRHAPEA